MKVQAIRSFGNKNPTLTLINVLIKLKIRLQHSQPDKEHVQTHVTNITLNHEQYNSYNLSYFLLN